MNNDTLIDVIAEVQANGWEYGTHPRDKARIVLEAIQNHLASPEVVERVARAMNIADTDEQGENDWIPYVTMAKAALQVMGGLSRTGTIDSCADDDRGLPARCEISDVDIRYPIHEVIKASVKNRIPVGLISWDEETAKALTELEAIMKQQGEKL